MRDIYVLLLLLLAVGTACDSTTTSAPAPAPTMSGPDSLTVIGRWSSDKVQEYYTRRPWQVGSNYNPRDAINQLEMWQEETFNPDMIDEELGWAAEIGMTSMRVYLHNLVWEQDSSAFLERIERYLSIADGHGISTSFVLFDAVWDPVSDLGPQPEPRPHVHNSGWVQSPQSKQLLRAERYYPKGKSYVQGILRHFRNDERIFMWDLYNEPDNDNFGKFPNEPKNKAEFVYPLLVKTFVWAREVNPSQPLTAGVWFGDFFNDIDANKPLNRFNAFQLANSDLISYHHYRDVDHHRKIIAKLKKYDRPLVCTEYLARTHGSTIETALPLMKENSVAAYNWGLVAGKTQTNYPWSSWDSTFVAEPHLWHHEIFYPDGRPYRAEEVRVIEELGSRK